MLYFVKRTFLIYESEKWFSRARLFGIPWTVAHQATPRILEWVAVPFSRDVPFPTQGWNQGFLHCRLIFYCLRPPGKPNKTGAGRLSLLQRIFLTQNSNRGLLHCIYQLWSESPSVVSDCLRPHGILQAIILEWAFPFSRGVFPTPGSNRGCLLHRRILYQLNHKGIPPCRGIELQSPAWQAGILTPILTRTAFTEPPSIICLF